MTQLSQHAQILARLHKLSQAAKLRGSKGAYDRYQELIARFVSTFPKADAELREAYAPDGGRGDRSTRRRES
jgi:hypothetical protein